MSFVRIITGLVWGLQPFIFGFGYYHESELNNTFIFGSSLVYMVALLSIPFIVRHRRISSVLQALLIASMMLNGLGSFGWYWTTVHYDDAVHFLSPAILMWGMCIWFQPKHLWVPLVTALLIGLVWEPVEYYGDQVFGTRTYGQPGQSLDTVYDLVMDTLGVGFGLILYRFTRQPVLMWIRG